ncbi:hypothetical protein FQZ97_421890 [compost metagenome]
MPIVDVARCQLRCGTQRLIAVLDMVVLLEARLEPPEDAHGVLDRRLGDIDLLEAPSESPILLEDAAELLEGGGTDAADLTRRQQGLEQVGCIHHAARGSPGTDDGVDLVDEEDGMGALAQLVEQRLEALLEIAAVFGAGQQRTEIQGIDHAVSQQVRHLIVDDTLGQAFCDGGLADTGLTHQQRVVLATTGQDLGDALDLGLATDQRIDTPQARQFVQVAGIGIQGMAGGSGLPALLVLHLLVVIVLLTVPRHLGDAMGDVVDDVDAGHALLLQQEYGLAFLLAEDRHQYIGTGHFALTGTLHVEHRTL